MKLSVALLLLGLILVVSVNADHHYESHETEDASDESFDDEVTASPQG